MKSVEPPKKSRPTDRKAARPIPVPTAFRPFSKKFICPRCGEIDSGRYCSSCREPLRLKQDEILRSAIARLRSLGYVSQGDFFDEEKVPYAHHDLIFSSLLSGGAEVLILPSWQKKGRAYYLTIFSRHDQINPNTIIQRVHSFVSSNSHQVPTKHKVPIEAIFIRYVLLVNSTRVGLARKIFERAKGTRVESHSVVVQMEWTSIRWSIDVFDVRSGKLFRHRRVPYDIVLEELQAAAKQSQPQKSAQANRQHISIRVLKSIFEEVIKYCRLFSAYTANRYVVADLVLNKGFMTKEEIVSLYLVGIPLSFLVPISFSLGVIKIPDIQTIHELPPLVGEIVELGIDLVKVGVQTISLMFVLRLMKQRVQFGTLFFGLLFGNAFFQLVDRSYEILTGKYSAELIEGLLHGRPRKTNSLLNQLELLRTSLYIWFIYPLIYAATGLEPRRGRRALILAPIALTVSVILVVGILALVTPDKTHKDEQTMQQLNSIVAEMERIEKQYDSLDQARTAGMVDSILFSKVGELLLKQDTLSLALSNIEVENTSANEILLHIYSAQRDRNLYLTKCLNHVNDCTQLKKYDSNVIKAIDAWNNFLKD